MIDDYVYVRFEDPLVLSSNYRKSCLIVDDMIVTVKGSVTIEMFDAHVEAGALSFLAQTFAFLQGPPLWNFNIQHVSDYQGRHPDASAAPTWLRLLACRRLRDVTGTP